MMELLVPCPHHLADPRQPATQPLGPRCLTIALGMTNDLDAIASQPCLLIGLSLEALVDHVGPTGRRSHTRQAWMGLAAQSTEGFCQGLILGAGAAKAKARDHPDRVYDQQQVEAFILPEPVAPADSSQPRQPASAPALGVPRGKARAVQGFIETMRGGQEPAQIQKVDHQGNVVLAHLPIELLPRGQLGKGREQMALCIAVKAAFAAKALPLPERSPGSPSRCA